jgi:hypothetical protein
MCAPYYVPPAEQSSGVVERNLSKYHENFLAMHA